MLRFRFAKWNLFTTGSIEYDHVLNPRKHRNYLRRDQVPILGIVAAIDGAFAFRLPPNVPKSLAPRAGKRMRWPFDRPGARKRAQALRGDSRNRSL